jgi:hypothetical protein
VLPAVFSMYQVQLYHLFVPSKILHILATSYMNCMEEPYSGLWTYIGETFSTCINVLLLCFDMVCARVCECERESHVICVVSVGGSKDRTRIALCSSNPIPDGNKKGLN